MQIGITIACRARICPNRAVPFRATDPRPRRRGSGGLGHGDLLHLSHEMGNAARPLRSSFWSSLTTPPVFTAAEGSFAPRSASLQGKRCGCSYPRETSRFSDGARIDCLGRCEDRLRSSTRVQRTSKRRGLSLTITGRKTEAASRSLRLRRATPLVGTRSLLPRTESNPGVKYFAYQYRSPWRLTSDARGYEPCER